MKNIGSLIVHEYDSQTLVHRLRAGDSGGDWDDDVMTTIEELRDYANDDRTGPCCVYSISNLMTRAADELETLQKEVEKMKRWYCEQREAKEALQKANADLHKQIAELTVKKTQVYKP